MSLIWASSVTALTVSSSSNDGNPDINTLDGDFNTRWSAQGHGQWIEYDLEFVHELTNIDIAFYKGDLRATEFAIASSIDGKDWNTLWHGVQADLTSAMQSFQAEQSGVKARYLRIVGYGNSENDWISISEVYVHGRVAETTLNNGTSSIPASQYPAYSSSVNHQDSSVLDALDGDLNTYWAANGLRQWLAFDLGKKQHVSSIDISFYKGDERVSTFEIETSLDGLNWTTVFSGQQPALTTHLQNINTEDIYARHLRIKAFGNSQNNWFTLSEVNINSDTLSF